MAEYGVDNSIHVKFNVMTCDYKFNFTFDNVHIQASKYKEIFYCRNWACAGDPSL